MLRAQNLRAGSLAERYQNHCPLQDTLNRNTRLPTPQIHVRHRKSWNHVSVVARLVHQHRNEQTKGKVMVAIVAENMQKRWHSTGGRRSIALLVDADSISMSKIQAAQQVLREHGEVETTIVFGPPQRAQNQRWSKFMSANNITFQKVARNSYSVQDPNDTEIWRKAHELASLSFAQRIALLVYDADFIPLIEKIRKLGKDPIVILPDDNRISLVDRFKRTQALVLIAEPGRAQGRVRAVLEASGSGTIRVEDLQDLLAQDVDANTIDVIAGRLENLQYRKQGETPNINVLTPAIAKFWFAHQLGPLTVYPGSYAMQMMDNLWLKDTGRCWQPQTEDFAFVLPKTNATKTNAQFAKYGSVGCGQIAGGGGPFIMKDSDTLSEKFLHKLGYLDTSLNRNMDEAIQIFSKINYNKRILRKLGVNLLESKAPATALSQLRSALLNNETGGAWQPPPKDTSVRRHLASKGHLPNIEAANEEVFEVLKKHSQTLGLPSMSTYNGYLFHFLLRFSRSDPNRRQ